MVALTPSRMLPLCVRGVIKDFGDNPTKTKVITEMRDWWYDTVEGTQSKGDLLFSEAVPFCHYRLL
jgi:hypothetical protein